MDYKDTINYLFAQTPSFEKTGKTGFKEGLHTTLLLDEHFQHPHLQFKSIHVAGTNGKGSVSHTLTAHLQAAGYRVGLYTSPHLVDFRERIRVNGQMIDKDYVVKFVQNFLEWNEKEAQLEPSFFEITTAMAFRYFADMQVDIAVVEVGLGGRLDCTNIITPILSVITNISFDHTDMLGNTLQLIAREKAGIIKHGVPVVVGEAQSETRPVFEQVANEQQAPIVFAEDAPMVVSAEPLAIGGMRYLLADGTVFVGELSGLYQAKNTNTVLTALECLVTQSVIKKIYFAPFSQIGSTTGLMGRWQRLQTNPLTISDTGHNVGGWNYLSQQIAQQKCKQLRLVFGMVNDKDITAVMKMLPKNAAYYFTKASTHRAINEEKLQEMAIAVGLKGRPYPTVAEAFQAAVADSSNDDFVFVGGSTYVVADLMAYLQANRQGKP